MYQSELLTKTSHPSPGASTLISRLMEILEDWDLSSVIKTLANKFLSETLLLATLPSLFFQIFVPIFVYIYFNLMETAECSGRSGLGCPSGRASPGHRDPLQEPLAAGDNGFSAAPPHGSIRQGRITLPWQTSFAFLSKHLSLIHWAFRSV